MPAPLLAFAGAAALQGLRAGGTWLLRRAFTSAATNGARSFSLGRTLTTASVADMATGNHVADAAVDAVLGGGDDPDSTSVDGDFPVMETVATLASVGLAALNPSVLTLGVAAAVTAFMAPNILQAVRQPNEPAPAPV